MIPEVRAGRDALRADALKSRRPLASLERWRGVERALYSMFMMGEVASLRKCWYNKGGNPG